MSNNANNGELISPIGDGEERHGRSSIASAATSSVVPRSRRRPALPIARLEGPAVGLALLCCALMVASAGALTVHAATGPAAQPSRPTALAPRLTPAPAVASADSHTSSAPASHVIPASPAAIRVEVPAPAGGPSESCSAGVACASPAPAGGGGGGVLTEWYNTTTSADAYASWSPPFLVGASMAYDPGNPMYAPVGGVEILFGGLAPWGAVNYTYAGVPVSTTLPTGASTSSLLWVNLSSFIPAPSVRYYSSLAYDAQDGYLVMFGGQYAGGNETMNDTWTLSVTYEGEDDGGYNFVIFGWTKLTERTAPSVRGGAAFAYDAQDHYLVLYGGYDDPNYLGDTWNFSGGKWTHLHPMTSPPLDAYGVFEEDGAGDLLATGFGANQQAWQFAHGAWTELPVRTPLGARFDVSGAYDNATGLVTVFGGANETSPFPNYGDTWNYSSASDTWTELQTSGPIPRAAAAMAYDPQIGCSVLYGGGTSPGGWFRDTWIFCTWPTSVAPFSVTLVATPAASAEPSVVAGGNATFTAYPAGGTWPYSFAINLYDAFTPPIESSDGYANGPYSTIFTFSTSANYFVAVGATDSEGAVAGANLTYPVGTVMVPDWQPLWDSYSFVNYGSAWSTGGNCYGFSTTMILYWEHDIAGESGTPYLPSPVWSTSRLVEGTPVEPDDGPGMDGATLAIMLHQTMDPANNVFDGGGFASSDMAANYATLLGELDAGHPGMMYLQVVGGGYHAVVAYGEDTLPDGNIDIDVSDPNAPQATINAVYDPSAETFALTDPFLSANAFELPTDTQVQTLTPSWFGSWTAGSSNDYDTQSNGYYFVAGVAPLTVSQSGVGTDSFSDGGSTADSQTFVQGIPNSAGVEEPSSGGTVQAFALENLGDNVYSVTDPGTGPAPIQVLLATNVSGTTMVRGYDLNLTSAGEHDVSLELASGGTTLRVANATADVNLSFGQLIGSVSDKLTASDLAFPAGSVVTFTVLNWSALGSTSTPSVEVRVVADNGTGATTEYLLENGQTGLGTGKTVYYLVGFQESGLPAKTLAKDGWTVELNGTVEHRRSATILFNETTGNLSELVTGPAGWTVVMGAGDSLLVSGPTTVDVGLGKGRTVTVTFAAKGLPKAQPWCVELSGESRCVSTGSAKFSNLTVGDYPYAVLSPRSGQNVSATLDRTPVPTAGLLDVTDNERIVLTFVYRYAVTFSETGPLNGTWSVTIQGVTRSNATGSPIVFDLPNGTYSYKIGAESGLVSSGSPVRLSVHGAATSVAVTFRSKGGMDPAVPIAGPTPGPGVAYVLGVFLPVVGWGRRGGRNGDRRSDRGTGPAPRPVRPRALEVDRP